MAGQLSGSRQINVYVCLGVTLAAAVTTLILRLAARRITKISLWWDDYLAILAFLFAGVWTGLVLWWLDIGLGLHLSEIDTNDAEVQERSRLILWTLELFYAFSLACAKLSILAFYWRMFKSSNLKTPIYVLTACAIIWLILRTFLAIFHCVPVQRFWDISVKGVCNIDDSRFFFGTVLAHLIIDVAILILPVMQIRRLQLPLFKKVAVISMFMFGIFVCIASIVVLDESLKYDAKSPEIPWNISPIIIWATAEVNLAIVSACLPMLRPIYNLARRIPNSKGSSGGGVYGHASSHTGAIKLTTVNIKNKGKGSDDGDSTYKLARSLSGQREGSIGSNSEYNSNVPAHDGRGHGHGPSTVITGQFRQQRQQKPQRSQVVDEERLAGIGGIVVTEEIGVRVSRLK